MSNEFRIFVVDDDPMIRAALSSILEADYAFELFEDAESCLTTIEDMTPSMVLLDVGLPGMDGYALCRTLKERDDTKDIPVTFVSAHDTLESRLIGYEAGGDDFVVKPFEVSEIQRKVVVAQRLWEGKKRIVDQATSADELSNVLMASMNDYGVLVSFLGKMAGCTSADEVCEAVQQALRNFSLDGVTQVRIRGESFTASQQGRDVPIEVSIMTHVSTMERIFEFKNRAVFNHGRITIMINNMPLQDTDACGRIRDNIAIVVQGADARLQGIEADRVMAQKQEGIRTLLGSVATTITLLNDRQKRDQMRATEITFRLQEDLANSFVHLGLTDRQERFLEDMVRHYAGTLMELNDSGAETQVLLEELISDLRQLEA